MRKLAVFIALAVIALPAPALAAPLQSTGAPPPTKLACNGFIRDFERYDEDLPVRGMFLEISNDHVIIKFSSYDMPDSKHKIIFQDDVKIVLEEKSQNFTGNISKIDGEFDFWTKKAGSNVVVRRYKGYCKPYRPMFYIGSQINSSPNIRHPSPANDHGHAANGLVPDKQIGIISPPTRSMAPMKFAVSASLLVTALSAPALASDWVLVAESVRDSKYYIDRQSIRTMPNGYKRAWER
jgi:hypothetical protein